MKTLKVLHLICVIGVVWICHIHELVIWALTLFMILFGTGPIVGGEYANWKGCFLIRDCFRIIRF